MTIWPIDNRLNGQIKPPWCSKALVKTLPFKSDAMFWPVTLYGELLCNLLLPLQSWVAWACYLFCFLAGKQHKHNMLCRPASKLACFSENSDQVKLLFCVGCQGCQDCVCCQGNLYIAWCFAFRLPTGCIPKAGMPCQQVDCRLMALLCLLLTYVFWWTDSPAHIANHIQTADLLHAALLDQSDFAGCISWLLM